MPLDTKQALAIASDKLILTGGPGTGKTYCMIKKLEILINEKKIDPEKILILYHGNSALEQFKNKINDLWGQEIADNIEVSTILDFCISLCGENFFQIFKGNKSIWTAQKQETVVDNILMDLFPDSFSEEQTKDVVQKINIIRQKNIVNADLITQSYEEFQKISEIKKSKRISINPADIDLEQFNKIYYRYCDQITENNIDYLELLKIVLSHLALDKNKNLIRESWSFFMMDEFQGVDEMQGNLIYELVKIFKNNIWIIGDDKQCISGYSGSKSNTISEFSQKHDSFLNIKLTHNYRNCKRVIEVCRKLFPDNELIDDPTAPEGYVEHKQFNSMMEEQAFIAKKILELDGAGMSNIAILNRTNVDSAKYRKDICQSIKKNSPSEKHKDLNIFGVLEHPKHISQIKIIIFLFFTWSWDIESSEAKEFPFQYYNIWSDNEQTNPFNKKEFISINKHWEKQGKIDLMYLHKMENISPDKQNTGIEFCDVIQDIKSIQINEENANISVVELMKLLWDAADLKGNQSGIFKNLPKHKKNYLIRTIQHEFKNIYLDPQNRKNLFEATKKFMGKINQIYVSKKQLHNSKNRILSINLHAVSGMEFDYVFICGLVEKNIPTFYAVEMNDEEKIMEEKKLLYAAISTAKKSLFLLSSPRGRKSEHVSPTRFLSEMLCQGS